MSCNDNNNNNLINAIRNLKSVLFFFRNGPIMGVPGVPGSTEIAEALKRLTPAEVTARRAALGNNAPVCRGYGEYDATIVPLGCRTPDSIMSTGSSGYNGHSYWRLPNKLQVRGRPFFHF